MSVSRQQIDTADALIEELRDIVGDESVLSEPDELLVYECDGLPQHKHPPRAVVFPTSTEDTAEVLKILSRERVSFAPRGAGTGLSGGALAIDRGVVIELARMREILKIDPQNREAVVQTGLVNAQLSRAVAPYGLYYVPDPSSQPSCTIGGNIAENAGGIHCLKYGTTTDHVIGARVVLSDGSIIDLDHNAPGYDLLGVFVGSEGTFGIATEATVKLSRIPPAVRTLLADFLDVDDASRAVSAIIAAGMLPAALEMMDNAIIRAVEASVFTAGLPIDAQAVLLVELDGVEAGIDDDAEKVGAILRGHGARSVRSATDEKERKKLWAARKGAFGAVGRLMPDVMIQDAVVPRSRLPEILAETYRISARYNLQLANVFHAGDGNLHPLICFDLRRGADLENVRQAGREIMETCVRAGGSITGEHGVGLDKSSYLPLIFSEDDMDAMLRVRAAFDPSGLCNPGKIIPMPRGCGEARAVATQTMSEPRALASGSSERPGISDPVASARGTDTGQGEGFARSNFVPHSNPLSKGEGEARSVWQRTTNSKTLVATKLNEARISRELTRLVGEQNTRRVSIETRSKPAIRTTEVAPASTKEAAEVIKFALAENLAVIPAGGASWIEAGNLLDRADIVVSTRRMTRILKHEPADLVATAEAGTKLIEFQNHLKQAGQWLPIDTPNSSATLGGVVATSWNGPHSFGYGPLRSFVIGMKVLLANGQTIKAGGTVVKNVAGYDLCKLFTGSYGTLGLITELTFKLRPLPAETRTIVATGSMASLFAAGRTIANKTFPVAVELLSPRLAPQIASETNSGDCALLIRFAGSTQAVITQAAQALKILRDEANTHCAVYDDDEQFWRKLNGAASDTQFDLVWHSRMRPTNLETLLTDIIGIETGEASLVQLKWHAGLGDGRFQAMAQPSAYHQQTVRALEQLRRKAENLGGGLVIDRAPLEIKNELDAWGSLGSAGELMKRIKQQLDPENLFSPGRIFI
jgi:glycolate oxidase subunit GlcD